MITPEEFPYIKSLYVNDCYAYKDFNIDLHGYKPFSHLILTGKNGSGKSTILEHLHNYISGWQTIDGRWFQANTNSLLLYIDTLQHERDDKLKTYKLYDETDNDYRQRLINELNKYERVVPSINAVVEGFWEQNKSLIVYSYFKAKRESRVKVVNTVTKDNDFTNKLIDSNSTDYFIEQFKQYLVNKKVEQAFYQIEKQKDESDYIDNFFSILTKRFRQIFEDESLQLVFQRENFEFFIQLSDGRQLTFDVLSEGFSALLSILMDLFIRVDLIRKQVGGFAYNPCGIVLIDEPETHLHLQSQEQVLPLLTSLFPNIQFIAATHSPAVIASIKNATIFDLTTKETRISEEAVGRSYSDLMRSHFGMNNEYSGIADELFKKVDEILKENKNKPEELKSKLQQFFVENEAYFSPSFRVELESMILENA
ncbi:AAA family ATPase [Spirosoma sp. 48-14]|uniref:AAA family ATPase n=1 Tax=Spirosoma sp. 48-14 TaxID=1895854 RepID=UPI00095BD815|nr:AAA family ATPase [Spirosoma sp. 48-14]OJW75668.1 MAG: AAA family ATPase [Spirosoma sp. 48-14]